MDKKREGELFKTVTVEGVSFEIKYGYYSEEERARWGPTPIYPDFIKNPLYSPEGTPFAKADQDICEHYNPKPQVSGEEWCNDCRHFEGGGEVIGVCKSPKRQREAK